ncbi:hypothetical protein AB0A69_30600 [Streptomyces sp. NPDC045431]|uniref:hypothetical protein n=1 Tax=Streptomyces sp. NPDC045431 TaxID=3155613 RepID=UPI0033F61706
MKPKHDAWTGTWTRVALAASGWPVLAATALPGGSPLRWIPVLLFLALAPGLALLHPRRGARTQPLETLAFAVPLSLSLVALVATALFLAEAFSTTAFLVALAVFVTVAAALPGVPLPADTREGAG